MPNTSMRSRRKSSAVRQSSSTVRGLATTPWSPSLRASRNAMAGSRRLCPARGLKMRPMPDMCSSSPCVTRGESRATGGCGGSRRETSRRRRGRLGLADDGRELPQERLRVFEVEGRDAHDALSLAVETKTRRVQLSVERDAQGPQEARELSRLAELL